MPLVTVQVIEGVFSQQDKQNMIERITDTMVGIEGENLREVTWVKIEEVKSGDWGIGGKALTTEMVQQPAGPERRGPSPGHWPEGTREPAERSM